MSVVDAVLHQDALELRQLVAAKADLDQRCERRGCTATCLAASVADTQSLQILLDGRADPNRKSSEDYTPLMLATHSEACITMLLAVGADLNHQSRLHGGSALMWSVSFGNPRCTALLLQAQADTGLRSFDDAATALLWAAGPTGSCAVVRSLIEHAADPDTQDSSGQTALMIAVRSTNLEKASLLIQAGAGVGVSDNAGYPLLTHCATNLMTSFVCSAQGKSALHRVASGQFTERLYALLMGGATTTQDCLQVLATTSLSPMHRLLVHRACVWTPTNHPWFPATWRAAVAWLTSCVQQRGWQLPALVWETIVSHIPREWGACMFLASRSN